MINNIPRIIRKVSSLETICYFVDYKLNYNGPGRRYSTQNKPDCWNLVFSLFGITPNAEEPIYKNFVGNHFLEGSFVNEHKDYSPIGFDHIRINYMIKKPKLGGDPVIDGVLIPVSQGDLWICIANRENHASTPIFGGERIIYSFGCLISVEQTEKFIINNNIN